MSQPDDANTRAKFIAYHQARLSRQEAAKVLERFGAETPDRILDRESAVLCIQELAALGLLISACNFWCNCTGENARLYGCPHGGGGYNHGRGGYYSECYHLDGYDLEDRGLNFRVDPSEYAAVIGRGNAQMIHYLTRQLPGEPFFSPCLHVALEFPV